ncbi:hybrid sensor histidine kinase/response regulator [Massilia consociata]|uniref:histidine kinase n=1 Tax=Massilia consociata TaxID=760117 RepID=A0ABV6FLM8_9BURK
MPAVDAPPQDTAEQGVRDLMGLLALPALWAGRDGETILQLMLQAIYRVVPVRLSYLETVVLPEQPTLVRMHLDGLPVEQEAQATLATACQALLRTPVADGRVFEADTPLGPMRLLRLSMGYGQLGGKILFGSPDVQFPTFNQMAFLRAATSLAVTGLHAARATHEREQASRAKDEFLAMLAHELRNPLAPISAAADLLSMTAAGEQARHASGVITRQVRHMTGLIDDLLDVSRVTRGLVALERAPVDVKRLVALALEQSQPLVEAKRHRVALELPPGPACVDGDAKRLVQVLVNLLNNAAKYTPEGGSIGVRVATAPDTVTIEVSDNGIGMEPGLIRRAFELFVQAERTPDRSQGGLGLGLPLVRSLVGLHGGKVSAHSEGIGHGSRLRVMLPRSEAQGDEVDAVQAPADAQSRQALRTLVVDDNEDAASTLVMYLEASGHVVTVEHDPARAIEAAKSGTFDALLLDLGLPGMDGYELARRIRLQPGAARATIVAITGYGHASDREKSAAAGFDHHFVKPVDMARLVALLSQLHDVGRTPSDT